MKRCSSLLAATLALAACSGGGGDGSGSASAKGAEGIWIGPATNGRTVYAVILDDGTYWALYSTTSDSTLIAGFIEGNGDASGNAFSSSNGRDFNFEGLGVNDLSLDATFTEKSSINGTVTYDAGGSLGFSGSYSALYDQTPAIPAGTYNGYVGGSVASTVTVNSSGAFSGTSSAGCTFTGQATPRAHGNVFDAAVTFNVATGCPIPNASGIAVYDPSTGTLDSAGLTSDRAGVFLFVGRKA